jgi:hypothetical protein
MPYAMQRTNSQTLRASPPVPLRVPPQHQIHAQQLRSSRLAGVKLSQRRNRVPEHITIHYITATANAVDVVLL